MKFEVVEEPLDRLAAHALIPIRFEVRSVFEIIGDDPESAVLAERQADPAWVKDYDSVLRTPGLPVVVHREECLQ